MEPKDKILQTARELGLTMTAEFVPFSQSRNKGEKYPSLNWRVTLLRGKTHNSVPVLTTDYSAGCAQCPSYKQGDRAIHRAERVAWECEHGKRSTLLGGMVVGTGKVLQPDFADVLSSLVMDAGVLDSSSFEDWASEFGYDTDSRTAEKLYRACLEIALKLRNSIGEAGLASLRDACQDY